MKSAALLVIGDEILTGKVQDINSFVFAKTMFEQGVRVERIVTIPDDIEVIADKVEKCAKKFDYLCTSGGVGPTHDDKTFDGIALGLSLPLKLHEEALHYFQREQSRAGRGEGVSDVQKKMLTFPTPCQVFYVEPLWLPLVVARNVYVLPGVPYLFEKLMTSFAHLFKGGKFYRGCLFTNKSESTIALPLKDVQDRYASVAIGSYPQMPGHAYNVMVTVEGIDENMVNTVVKELLPLIDGRETA
jgi:molybdenum cofactor synthesis domain-containing protein